MSNSLPERPQYKNLSMAEFCRKVVKDFVESGEKELLIAERPIRKDGNEYRSISEIVNKTNRALGYYLYSKYGSKRINDSKMLYEVEAEHYRATSRKHNLLLLWDGKTCTYSPDDRMYIVTLRTITNEKKYSFREFYFGAAVNTATSLLYEQNNTSDETWRISAINEE